MRLGLVAASLVALAAAAPIETGGNTGDVAYVKYAPYKGYTPYAGYGKYSSNAEEEAAKMDGNEPIMKRDASEQMERNKQSYGDYSPYATYGPYHGSVDAEVAKMQQEKRDMVMSDKDFGVDMKRDMDHPDAAEMAGSSESRADGTLPNNWYGKYDPYKDYGKYHNYDKYSG